MSEAELERLCKHEAGYQDVFAIVERHPHAWYLRMPEIPNWYDGNHALHLREDGRDTETIMREIVGYYRAHGLQPIVDIDPIAKQQGFETAALNLGLLSVDYHWYLLRHDLEFIPDLRNSEFEVRRVANGGMEGGSGDWITLRIYEDVGSDFEEFARKAALKEAQSSVCRLYVAYQNGIAAACCAAYLADGWSRIENVLTHPNFRRRGAATTLIRYVLEELKSEQAELAFLFTDQDSDAERMYRKLGFTTWGLDVLHRYKAKQ